MSNPYRQIWKNLEDTQPNPRFIRKTITQEYKKFRTEIFSGNSAEIVESMYKGDVYILKKALSNEHLARIQKKTQQLYETVPLKSEFVHTDHDCPNFRYQENSVLDGKVDYKVLDHSFYLFRWNQVPLKLFEEVDFFWDTCKYLGGLSKNAYKQNRSIDGAIDRLQIIHYVHGGGRIAPHFDPTNNIKVQSLILLNKKGVDYTKGGLCVFQKNFLKKDVEKHIEAGDMVLFYPSLYHCVEPVDEHKPLNWQSKNGRWCLLLTSMDSELVENRTVSLPIPTTNNLS